MKNLIFTIMLLVVTTVNAQAKDSIIKTGIVHSTTPVGAIITSILDYDTFKKLNPNTYQNYVLCDGRKIDENSAYYKFSHTAPDLRGLFIRGVNQMDVAEKDVVSNGQKNPENKKAGEFQSDSFKKHDHKIGRGLNGNDITSIPTTELRPEGGKNTTISRTHKSGEPETRPKNMSVYYYLKIN